MVGSFLVLILRPDKKHSKVFYCGAQEKYGRHHRRLCRRGRISGTNIKLL